MAISIANMLEVVRKGCGMPVSHLSADWTYELYHDPDVVEVAHSWSFGRESFRDVPLTAPLFRWAFEDGRKFQGRPRVKIKWRKWASFPCGGETPELDQMKMMAELQEMIRKSASTLGAQPQAEPRDEPQSPTLQQDHHAPDGTKGHEHDA